MCTSLFALFWYRFRPLVRILLLVIFTILEAVLLIGINWTFATRCGMYAQFYLVLISAGIGIATPLSRSRAAMASWAFVAAASLILQPLVPAISINSLLNLVGTLIFTGLMTCWFVVQGGLLEQQLVGRQEGERLPFLFFYTDTLLFILLLLVGWVVIIGICLVPDKKRLPLDESAQPAPGDALPTR